MFIEIIFLHDEPDITSTFVSMVSSEFSVFKNSFVCLVLVFSFRQSSSAANTAPQPLSKKAYVDIHRLPAVVFTRTGTIVISGPVFLVLTIQPVAPGIVVLLSCWLLDSLAGSCNTVGCLLLHVVHFSGKLNKFS